VPVVGPHQGQLPRTSTGPGYSLTASNAVFDAAAEQFAAAHDRLLDLAALQASV
jgi:hypothetical protein